MSIQVKAVPAFQDNYIWMIINSDNHCLCVDPGDAQPVERFLQSEQLILDAILITHHHWDHTNGIPALVASRDCPVYGPAKECQEQKLCPLEDEAALALDGFPEFRINEIPGHTLGHIAYIADDCLFSGDTLFTAGCGRVFEGSMAQMLASLDRLNQLPEKTQVYCGHEYTLNNLAFAECVEPNNRAISQRIQHVTELRHQQQPSVPATLALERETNPFLRVREESVQQAVSKYCGQPCSSPLEVFSVLREWKNRF